ncbi:MAG TPA: DUF711 family protein [Dictyobacter sp.]|jgi:uncharacterized protein (UPF0210 family)|nr:DUF711 family protein [Dictyobacter sp.]
MIRKPPVRTITIGIDEPHPISRGTFASAHLILQQATEHFAEAGYEVQTLRLSTRPLLADLADWNGEAIARYVQQLEQICEDLGLAYCSLGTVDVTQPDFSLARLDLLADLLVCSRMMNATVQMASTEHGLREDAALPTAQIIQRLAHDTPEGFGNFRFAMLACVKAGSPFFPAAYHAGPASLTVGLQGAGLLVDALREHGADGQHPLALAEIATIVRDTLIEQATPVVAIARQLAQDRGILFGGIDVSPAPMGTESIGTALELCGYDQLGSSGTLAVAGAFTSALKSIPLQTCGYNGLMLPVLEDATLGQRWSEGSVNAHQLLLYSAICGTGLDTIPLPGDTPAERLAHLLLDVATLAQRYQKPLSARLFPVPGKKAGEQTTFTSPYLTNTRIGTY